MIKTEWFFLIFISFFSYLFINRTAIFLSYYLKQQWQNEYKLLNQSNFFNVTVHKKNYLFLLFTFYFTAITFLQQHSFMTTILILYFYWILLCLSEIDWYHGLLPDELTLSLMWCGLLINLNHTFTDSTSSILGAACGYMSLWLFNQLFFLCTKRQGMGYGDFKLFAAIGAWLGWQFLAIVLIAASVLSLIFSLFLWASEKKLYRILPFGPFMAFSAMAVMLNSNFVHQWNLFSWRH